MRGESSESYNRENTTTQSKVDDAFQVIYDRLETLGSTTSHLQDRLLIVSNNYPRPSDESPMMTKDEGPTGDSELLNRLYKISEDLTKQTTRINETINRFDI